MKKERTEGHPNQNHGAFAVNKTEHPNFNAGKHKENAMKLEGKIIRQEMHDKTNEADQLQKRREKNRQN